MKAIKLFANGTVQTIDIPPLAMSDWYEKQIGCDIIEYVHPRNYPDWTLLIDGNGLLKDNLTLNVLASVMYGTHEHGSPIVGNVLLVKTIITGTGYDVSGLNDNDIKKAYKMLDKVFLIAKGWELKVRREENAKKAHDKGHGKSIGTDRSIS